MIGRHPNTAREIEASGAWCKVGRKHYRHESGIEVRYDCNRWLWIVVGHGDGYRSLWIAVHRAEQIARGLTDTR